MNLNNNQWYHTNHKLGDLAYQHLTYDTAAENNVNRDVNHTSLWLLVKAFFCLGPNLSIKFCILGIFR